MDDYLAKPIRPAELFHVVEQFAPRYVSRRMPIHESQEVVAGASAANGQMFDRREALATVGNDAQLLGELIEIFLADSPKWLRDLQAALDQGKPEDARRLAHSLKNSAGYFGANQIKQLAYEIEQAAAQRQLAVAQEKCERVLRELERLGPELARCREELTAPAP
jgi:HPt (histidine-containing phosphotransfer) domain-containing protein